MTTEYTSWGKKAGTLAHHWGVRLDLTKPTTGVVQTNKVEWIYDEICNGIDLAWEDHLAECKGQCSHCRCNHENEKCDCYRVEAHEYAPCAYGEHDHCGPQERGTVLIGLWVKGEDGKYEPNKEGEYSAIVGECYTQVVWSKHIKHCAPCSPCYPGQADLDSPQEPDEDGFLAFDLPPSLYGDDE